MPTVASSVAELIGALSGIAHVEADRLIVDDESRFRDQAAADLAWTAAFSTDESTIAAARWIVWEAIAGPRRPVGEHPGALRRARPGGGPRVHRPRDQHPRADVRHGAHDLDAATRPMWAR